MSRACCNARHDAEKVLVLVNPKAGRGPAASQLDQLAERIRRHGAAVEVSGDLSWICDQANHSYREGALRALVGVGGDGTAAELVNRTDPGVPICLYPSGTSNLLARYLGLRADPAVAADAIAGGVVQHFDAGTANGRIFLMMASCGFDAEVVREVHRCRQEEGSGHLTYWSYAKPILDTIRSYQYPEIRVYCECARAGLDQLSPSSWVARWVFAFNLPLYGWGLPLAFWAEGTDGLLDVCTLERGSAWHGLRYLLAAQGRLQRRLRDCRVGLVTRLRITAERPVAYQLDGDPGGWLPLEIQVLPRRVTLIVPKGHRLRA